MVGNPVISLFKFDVYDTKQKIEWRRKNNKVNKNICLSLTLVSLGWHDHKFTDSKKHHR